MVNNLPMDDTDLTSHRRTLTRAMTDRKYGIGTFQDVKGKRPYQMIQHQTVVRFKCLGIGTGKKGKRKKCNSHFNSIHELRKHWESTTCKHDTTNSTEASPEDHGNHADNILDTFTGVIALNDILPETLLSRTVIIQTSELPPGTTIVLSSPTTPRKGTKDLISSIAADISECLTSWSSMSHTMYDAHEEKVQESTGRAPHGADLGHHHCVLDTLESSKWSIQKDEDQAHNNASSHSFPTRH